MGVETFPKYIEDAAGRKATRIAELKENIQKNEEALPKFKANNDKYFNSFWKMKSDLNNLSHEENPSPEVKSRMKELEATIIRLEKVFQEKKPEENIRLLKESIRAHKAELQRLTEGSIVDVATEKSSPARMNPNI